MAEQRVEEHHSGRNTFHEATLPVRPPARRRPIDFPALRGLVSMAEVLSLLHFHAATHRGGDQVRGKCPLHRPDEERRPTFSANLRRNIYQCFSRRCRSKGNQLDLWSHATGLPPYEAAVDLCERLGKDVPYLDGALKQKRTCQKDR